MELVGEELNAGTVSWTRSSNSVDAVFSPALSFLRVLSEVSAVISGIKHAVACLHPTLARMAEYYFNIQGKRFRPLLILLLSRALLSHGLYLGTLSSSSSVLLSSLFPSIGSLSLSWMNSSLSREYRRGQVEYDGDDPAAEAPDARGDH
jgi:hypothetical protein